MNSLDERLYHYEYRRQRPHNPTYNSNNVFNSINMFASMDLKPQQTRQNQSYSLSKNQYSMMNKSELAGSRAAGNYSRILPFLQIPRKNSLLTDKDSLYLQMLNQRTQNRMGRNQNQYSMNENKFVENAENRNQYAMNGQDSLTNKLKEFEMQRR